MIGRGGIAARDRHGAHAPAEEQRVLRQSNQDAADLRRDAHGLVAAAGANGGHDEDEQRAHHRHTTAWSTVTPQRRCVSALSDWKRMEGARRTGPSSETPSRARNAAGTG